MMDFFPLDQLKSNFKRIPDRNAFFIGGNYYTYAQLENQIIQIQQLILRSSGEHEQYVGVITLDDLQTYATIFALWYLGKTFIPLNPRNPADRNREVIRQTGLKTIITSGGGVDESLYTGLIDVQLVRTIDASEEKGDLQYLPASAEVDCYVLFTSGSTGSPKGVPVSRKNLGTFVHSFIHAGYQFTHEDRFLQIYDLSFDASVHCYTVPLAVGGCVYTVPQDQIKYLYAYQLMKDHELTFVKMPPSTLAYLQPYFGSILLKKLRWCLLGGEAFSVQLAKKWSECVPNAQIQNVYGPTEATINTHIYNWEGRTGEEKSHEGIVSIGKCFGDSVAVVVNDQLEILPVGEKGEMCLGGDQVVKGYWQDDQKTAEAFFKVQHMGELKRFYRTGDIVFRDGDGDFMFVGRLDSQVQIQGYRVELGEIEKHARDFLDLPNVTAIARTNLHGVTEVYLFTERSKEKQVDLHHYLEGKLPPYMLPHRIIDLDLFPKSPGGKINRSELEKIIANETT